MRPASWAGSILGSIVVLGSGIGADALAGPPEARTAIATSPSAPQVIDDFENLSAWSPQPADGVQMRLRSEPGPHGRAMRFDFRFTGGGYAVARRTGALDLPENYAFSFRIRGQAPTNTLEFKLVDSTGANVWWSVRRDFEFPKEWETIRIKKRHIQYAWGPLGGGEIRHVAALEIVVTAGSGGSGSVWIDDLRLETLPPPGAAPPEPVAWASSEEPGSEAAHVVDGDSMTAWYSRAGEARPALRLDLGTEREFGGLTVHWAPARHATHYTIELSEDGTRWRRVRRVSGGNGGRDDLYLPESEARHLRLRVDRLRDTRGVGIASIDIRPLEWSSTRNAFFEALASESPPGMFPRGFSGQMVRWTVVGADRDTREALVDEDGRLETGPGAFAIEPFLFLDGKLVTWKDVRTDQTLDSGTLPIPTTRWRFEGLSLEITAFATGEPGASGVAARYRLANNGTRAVRGTLFLAARPFQVNPPVQFLNQAGGAAPIREIRATGNALDVNGERAVTSLTRPEAFGASSFDGGSIVEFLRSGVLPPATRATDSFEAASGAWSYPFALVPTAVREVDLFVPLHPGTALPRLRDDEAARDWVESQLEQARRAWEERLSRVTLRLPESAHGAEAALRSQLAWVLVNRSGAAIQPGTRAYARSWIRDGALTCSALLRLGHPEAVRDFIDWYAPHQYPNGKIPCVVDARGADPVPEHDSSGEFVYLVAEYYRHTADGELAMRLLPRVLAAAAYLDSLRHERRTAEYQVPGQRQFYGLLPPSISHEGYSAKPMHSYWDDFWAVRGFRDAAFLAGALGRADERARLEAMAEEFERDVTASVREAMRVHRIDYVPGCADLGDFDATSTTIALSPTGAARLLPPEALQRTFEKYDTNFHERLNGAPWEAFTPYEIRNIGAYAHLGWRRRIPDLVDFFLACQKPPGWRQWPEIVWHEPPAPRFVGDLPHTWVGSDYIRSLLDMLAFEREADDALVVGAGVPLDWLRDSGVELRGLRTHYGQLGYTMRRDGSAVEVRIEPGVRVPAGGIVVQPPTPRPYREATIDGRPASVTPDGAVVVRALPATVVFRP